MPSALKRACVYGCPEDARTCQTHGRQAKQRTYNQARGTRTQQGYGTRWDKHRAWWLDELFRLEVPRAGLCGARLLGAHLTTDSECQEHGLIVQGTVADHISPVFSADDPTFYDPLALQLLCVHCDAKKRRRERDSSPRRGCARA